jgi:hypothetical protein
MIVDAGAGLYKGGKAYMTMRAAKLERQALQVAIKETVETSVAESKVARGSSNFREYANTGKRNVSRANPDEIRFTQDTASPNYSDGRTISETIEGLKINPEKAETISPIRVVENDGKFWTLDNRRLVAFQNARIKEIPVIIESLTSPKILKEFTKKFAPIEGGKKIVIATKAQRGEAQRLLRDYGKYSKD